MLRCISLCSLISLCTLSPVSQASAEFTDQLIVQFNNPQASGELRALGLSRAINQKLQYQRQMADGSSVYKLDSRQELSQVRGLARALEAVTGVRYAEADQLMQPVLSVPNDTHYGVQWHYQANDGGINAPAAWAQLSQTSSQTHVAVLDTGYRPHVDLVANLLPGADLINDLFVANDGDGRDMDPQDPGDWYANGECGGPGSSNSSWHGTHVAGTVAAETNNAEGVAGVGYNLAKVIPVRVLGKCGGYLSDIADGIRWSVGQSVSGVTDNPNPARVINMSLGGSGSCGTTYQSAINAAVAAGASVVVAAGNSQADAINYRPASCDNVITVAATNINGTRSYYSNFGSVVDIAAPGGEMNSDPTLGIGSTLNQGIQQPGGDSYVYYQGTSMASPHVAGIVALMLAKDPNLMPAQIHDLLTISARPFPSICSGCGAGIADAGRALVAIDGGPLPSLPSQPTITTILDNQDGTAALFWNDSDSETGYQLQRQKQNRRKWGDWSDIASPAENQIQLTDNSGVGTFNYRLRAINALGSSDWFNYGAVSITDNTNSDGGDGGASKNKTCKGRNC